MNWKYGASLLSLLLLVVIGAYWLYSSSAKPLSEQPQAPAQVAFTWEIVTTSTEQARGLSGRNDIPQNYGMLFVFENKDSYGFWMKDMLTSIDMIWLSDTGIILGITENVAPESFPQAYYPPEPVRYVLETKVGEADRQGWIVGTDLELPSPYE